MLSIENKKESANNWFSFLQSQICKQFELIENNFSKKNKKFKKTQ